MRSILMAKWRNWIVSTPSGFGSAAPRHRDSNVCKRRVMRTTAYRCRWARGSPLFTASFVELLSKLRPACILLR
ncbi:hypothetical protein BDW71DRAFT_87780 [Aspergillus fruticulosus]